MDTDQHFQGKYEVELKYRLPSKPAFMNVLAAIPHTVMLEDNVETDWHFDTEDRQLQAQNNAE
ncbi:hypothetical protein KU854_23010 [Enterovibrio sp. NIFS-20-8]|nr:hypothetical protein [Enterovibrio paralichthyis]